MARTAEIQSPPSPVVPIPRPAHSTVRYVTYPPLLLRHATPALRPLLKTPRHAHARSLLCSALLPCRAVPCPARPNPTQVPTKNALLLAAVLCVPVPALPSTYSKYFTARSLQ